MKESKAILIQNEIEKKEAHLSRLNAKHKELSIELDTLYHDIITTEQRIEYLQSQLITP